MKNDGVIMASGLQGFRASGLQGFRASGLQGFRDIIADSLRGFAIILVVTGHIIGIFCKNKLFSQNIHIISNYIYSFHMPFFFIIAGYAHGMKERFSPGQSYWPYLRKSVIELYLPCLYFSFLYWLPKFILLQHSAFAGDNFIRTANIIELIRIPLYGFNLYWFLCTLFFVKALHMFFECYVRREIINSLFWVLMYIIAVIFFIKGYSYHHSVFYLGIYFHTGFMIRKRNIISQDKKPGLFFGMILFIFGIAFFTISIFYGSANIFTRTGSSFCTSLALFVIFYALRITKSFLITLGMCSMVIYCLHEYIIVSCKIIFRLTGLSSSASPLILFVMCLLSAVLIPLMVVWLYKNVKCLRWVEYIFYPGRYKR